MKILDGHTLSQEEIVEKLADKGIQVSTFTIRTLLKIHKFKKRKMDKCKTIKDVVEINNSKILSDCVLNLLKIENQSL